MDYKILDHIGPRAIIKEDGQKVYDAIHPILMKGETTKLNFEGVAQFASPFFNYAIGQLLKDLTVDELKERLQIVHLKADGMMVVKRVIANASRYHTDVNHQKIVDSILEEQSRESE